MTKSTMEMIVPVISTAHMPDHRALDDIPFDVGYFVDVDCGHLVYLGPQDAYADTWLAPIENWLRAEYGEDTSWVRFDADGDVIPELPTWEW